MFPYAKILRQAWELTLTNKFLWLFSLFFVLGDIVGFVESFFNERYVILHLIGLLLTLTLLILTFRAEAGLIIAIKALLDKQQTSFKLAWKSGKLFFMRILGIGMIVIITLGALLLVLGYPVSHFYKQNQLTEAWTFGAIGGTIFLIVFVVLSLISIIASLFVVIFDQKIQEAFDKASAFVKQYLTPLLSLGLILLILQLLPVVILQILAYYTDDLISKIIGFGIFCFIGIVVTTFVHAAWILIFVELTKPQKLEDVQPVVLPEIV
jgi:hypothetical protein